MNGTSETAPKPKSIPFDFSEALVQIKAGQRVVDVTWGTGEWLELARCAALTGDIIVKYNQGNFAAYQPDANAMLVAQYLVVK